MKKTIVQPRIPISTAVSPKEYDRIAKLRERGWSVVDILRLGIEKAELQKIS